MVMETPEETGSPEKTPKDIPTQPFNELYTNKNPAISKLKQSKRVDKVLVNSQNDIQLTTNLKAATPTFIAGS